jgi:hypothetical protein
MSYLLGYNAAWSVESQLKFFHRKSRRISQARNQHEAGRRQLTFKGESGDITQKTENFTATDARTSDPNYRKNCESDC